MIWQDEDNPSTRCGIHCHSGGGMFSSAQKFRFAAFSRSDRGANELQRSRFDHQSKLKSELGINLYESIEGETSIEAARIGECPGVRSGERHRESAPFNLLKLEHGGTGAFPEKGDRTGRVAAYFSLKLNSGRPEFIPWHLIGSNGRPANGGCDAAAIFEEASLFLRTKASLCEAGQIQDPPESIGSIREVVAGSCGARSRVQTAEDHVEPYGKDVGLIHTQNTTVPFAAAVIVIATGDPTSAAAGELVIVLSFAGRRDSLALRLRACICEALFRLAQKRVGQFRVVDDPRKRSRSDHKRERDDGVGLCRRNVLRPSSRDQGTDQLVDALRDRASRLLVSSPQFTTECRERTWPQPIVAALVREIVQIVFQEGLFPPSGRGRRRVDVAIHIGRECLGNKLVLRREMAIEAAMTQPSGRHDLSQTGLVDSIASEFLGGDVEDPFSSLRRLLSRFFHLIDPFRTFQFLAVTHHL